MEMMRRSREPSVQGRGAYRSAQPITPAKSAAPLLWLQATAGNRAVTAILEVQRDPVPVETPGPTIAERITESRDQVTKGEIDAPAFEYYRTSATGTAA